MPSSPRRWSGRASCCVQIGLRLGSRVLQRYRRQFVRGEAKRGAFASNSEYVRDLVCERYLKESERAAKLKALDAALARGIADAEAGRAMPVDEAFRRLRAELKLSEEGAQ